MIDLKSRKLLDRISFKITFAAIPDLNQALTPNPKRGQVEDQQIGEDRSLRRASPANMWLTGI